jgi:hypothetical protein
VVEVSLTDNYLNIAQRRETVMSYPSLKHPCHPARLNAPVIRNINVLKSEGWRIVNVGAANQWVDPKSVYLNPYKVNQKDDYNTPPYSVNIKTYQQQDEYAGLVGTALSKWGLPTQEKFITRGEWFQLNFPDAKNFSTYDIRVPKKFCPKEHSVPEGSNAKNRLVSNRSMSDWTLVASNDETVWKTWVILDQVKNAQFVSGGTSYGKTVTGNDYYLSNCVFTSTLKTAVSYKYVRLVINALHPNNFENIFTLAYFGVASGGTWYPPKGSNPSLQYTYVTTSITPYGFDNNYTYNDSLKTPIVPVITTEAYNSSPYNNAVLERTDGGVTKRYYNDSNAHYPDIYTHGMDHAWMYNSKLAKNDGVTSEKWTRNTVARSIGRQETERNDGYRSPDLKAFFEYTDGLDENTSGVRYINFSLGKYLFSWPELHLFLNTAHYANVLKNKDYSGYNSMVEITKYNYTKMARDQTWRRTYNANFERRAERYYEGSTITTYVLPCSIGDTSPQGTCSSYNNRVPATGFNNLPPDQEVADPRFIWPQPFQGGSYLVSSSVVCPRDNTCNGIGGNSKNVTPAYCFWIGDSATYNTLVGAGFSVQNDFNLNIMFEGDTNNYNDIPQQCLGRLTLDNLDTTSPLNQFYPPPALYRQKGWRLVTDPTWTTLQDGGTTLPNAILSENGTVMFRFPDVRTAKGYKEFDTTTTSVKTYTGCEGPRLVGTSVTISCPTGKLQATDGTPGEKTPHIRVGKWDISQCRDSYTTLIDAPYVALPSRCVGQATCTLNEPDLGLSLVGPQKRQWQVGFSCDTSDLSRTATFTIPGGLTLAQLHENYSNLMKVCHKQSDDSVFSLKNYPETLRFYRAQMEREVLQLPQIKDALRKEERSYQRSLQQQREQYRDMAGHQGATGQREYFDPCRLVAYPIEQVANSILESIYNPIVSGINKVKILRDSLGLKTQRVSLGWSCNIPGLDDFINGLVNAALAVGRAFTEAFNFICEVGEKLIGALVNVGKFLAARLSQTFSGERMAGFYRGFSNGMSAGFSYLGQSLQNTAENFLNAVNAMATALTNFGSAVANFFTDPSIDNFVGLVGGLLSLTVSAFVFVLEIGLTVLNFLTDLAGMFIGFLADIGSWIATSIIGPIAKAFSDAASKLYEEFSKWFSWF